MYTLAVIIPVYKVKQYICACLASILRNHDLRFQYIFVDDGCSEGSLDHARSCYSDFFAQPNVQVIHRANGGLSAARNTGMEAIEAEYFTFLDSDDVLIDGYGSIVGGLLEQYSSDLFEFELIKFKDEAELERYRGKQPDYQVLYSGDIEQVRNRLFGESKWQAWRRIYKSSAFASRRFVEGIYYEDIVFCADIYLNQHTLTKIDAPLIGYRIHPQSITGIYARDMSEPLRLKYERSISYALDYFNRTHFSDFRVIDPLRILAAQYCQRILEHDTRPRIGSRQYFSRLIFVVKYVRGKPAIKRFLMAAFPGFYNWFLLKIGKGVY